MANQMIALQARAPQAAGLGNVVSQNAQLINMMMQQRVAQRQAEQAQQKMAIEAQLAGPQLEKATSEAQGARVKVFKDFMMVSTFGIANARNANDAIKIGEILKTEFNDPIFTNIVDQTLASIPEDPAQFGTWKDNTLLQSEDAIKQLEMKYPKPKSELAIGVGGQPYVVNTGGMRAPTIVKPRSLVPGPQATPTQMQPRTGQAEVEPSTVADGGLDGGVASVLANVKSDREYQTVLKAIENQNPNAAAAIRQAMPTFDPSRMEGIRAEAVRAFGGVGGPDIPLVAGPRGGPYEGYVEAPLDVRLKDPSVSPYPGSAQVPLPRVAAERRVEAQAAKDVELAAEKAKMLPAKQRVSTIVGKMKGAYEALNKAEAIPSEKRGGFANALDYLATSSLGREAQRLIGTEQSKYLTQITNLRKQLATAIKNATGMSAQEMNSNVELQLMLDTLSDPTQGIEAARQTLNDIEEIYGAPKPAAQRRTPTQRNDIDALLKKYGE